jgi:hypothetical protein
MAIPPLENRLADLITDDTVKEQTEQPAILLPEDQAQPMVTEPVQVAGLGSAFVESATRTVNVIRQAIKPAQQVPPTAAEQAVSEAAQKAVSDAAVKAEKQSTPGAVQEIKQKVMPSKRRVAPQQQQPLPPATTEEMQTAIQTVEQAAAQGPKLVDENVPGVFIAPADSNQTIAFLSGADAPAVGVDFNLNYIQAPEDIDKMIDATSRVFADSIDSAKRGVLSDEAVKDMAARLNIAPELLQARAGSTFNAEQLLAARHLLVRSADNLNKMSVRIKEMPAGTEDDNLLLEFRNSLATHAAIQMRLKAAQTETARALRSFRLPVDGSVGLSDPQQINSLLQEMGGRANLKNLAQAYGQLTLDQQARFTELAGSTTKQLGAIWQELYYSSLLLSPAPIERAFFGNIMMTLARPFDTFFASTVGKAGDKIITPIIGSKTGDDVMMSEAFIEIANFISSFPQATKAAYQAFVTDARVYSVGRDMDKMPDPAISAKLFADPESPTAKAVDFMGKAVRLWSRAMLATDEFTKAQVAAMETRRLAAREALIAMDNGVDMNTALNGMAMQITNPDARIVDRVHQGALEATLQSDLGAFGNALQKVRNDLGPVGTVLAPFIKVVINSQKQMLARTPVGQLALKEIREDYAAGGARRQMAMGKAAMGSSFMGLGYYLSLDGTITGAGPTDPNRRKFLTETTGWQPFSIKVGETEDGRGIYRSYAGLEPIGGMLGMAATLAEIGAVYGKEDDDEWHDLLLYSALLPFKYIGELPFMTSLSDFTSMIEQVKRDPKGEQANAAATKFFGGISQNMVGGVTPVPMPGAASLRLIENILDPERRDVSPDPTLPTEQKYFDFMFRSWLAKTPVLSGSQAVSRNLWGEEITVGETGPMNLVIPFNKRVRDLDPIEEKILEIAKVRQKMPVNKPGKVVANIQLSDAEYSDMLLLMNVTPINGVPLKAAIGDALVSPEFVEQMNRGAYEGIANKLSSIVSDYRDEAVANPAFAARHPDAAAQIARNRELALQQYQRIKREPLSID